MGSIFAVCPDGRSVDVPVPAGYVSDGLIWGSARSECSRATAAPLLGHLVSVLRWGVPSECEIREVADRLIGGLQLDRPWEISSLDRFAWGRETL
jgi:hypothetical protein